MTEWSWDVVGSVVVGGGKTEVEVMVRWLLARASSDHKPGVVAS